MSDPVFLPGGRDARGTLDTAPEGLPTPDADACVVACPPHPQHRGRRSDRRLRAVSDELTARGCDCLRFDYGPWDGGHGGRRDARNAVEWAGERYDRVALFGYSFGGTVAVSAAADGADVAAVAALAPPARVGAGPDGAGGVDAVAAVRALPTALPLCVLSGARDDVADVDPVVEAARNRGATVRAVRADHSFVGREREVADAVAGFLRPALHPDPCR
jgi:hypothetical protein